jgi:hypothetical protein
LGRSSSREQPGTKRFLAPLLLRPYLGSHTYQQLRWTDLRSLPHAARPTLHGPTPHASRTQEQLKLHVMCQIELKKVDLTAQALRLV